MSALAAPVALAAVAPGPEAPAPVKSPPQCIRPEPAALATSLGVSVEYLLPNDIAGFPSSLVGYALSFEVPTGPVLWRVEGAHAAVSNFSTAYGTLSVKVPLETPFLTAFVQAGGHYFAFFGDTTRASQWGGLLGLGLSTALSRAFRFEGTLKGYFQGQSFLAVSMGIRTPL